MDEGLVLARDLLTVLDGVGKLVKLLANEEFPHVLVQQVPQAVLVEKIHLELVDEARDKAKLAPLKDAEFHI